MNKLFKRGLALALGLVSATGMFAQGMPQMQPLPVDTAVRTGVLPNGLTYYVRHNETPKGQADFYIAQKVGSILENDDQRGLAHFLEHMCFNGTQNFPGKGIINWLETKGVKFGQNLNAYTSVDETVYNISAVPVSSKSVQDSCLLILHDWANALSLEPSEIDAERGVIHEEWRMRMVGQMRLLENLLPTIYPDSKYGHRMPIGTMEVVDNFPYQALVDYYHTWYRPDQQGIIVVGDVDPDYIVGKIKEYFTPIEMPKDAKERVYLTVNDTPGTIYAIGQDKEMQAPMAMMMFKMDKMLPKEIRNTQAYYPVTYMTTVIEQMLNQRLDDISNKPDAPFAAAGMSFGDFLISKTKDAVNLTIVSKGNDMPQAIQAVYRELLRAARGGFTQGEFERANAEIRSRYQKAYDTRNNTQNETFSSQYVRAFIDGNPIPGIEMEKQIMDAMTQAIPLQAVNQLLPELIKNDNRVLLVMMPEAEGFSLPTEPQLADALTAVDGEELEPYKDEMKAEPLIPNLPAPGKIVSETRNDQWNAIEYTLSNGVKVVVKPTNFKENEIVFQAFALGGISTLPEEAAATVLFFPYASTKQGLGDYTNSDLAKYLQGKQVGVNFSADSYTRELSGNSTKQDLPTLMELIYANFTEFNITPEEFQAAQNMFNGVLANQENTAEFNFGKLLSKVLFKSGLRQQITTDAINKADQALTVKIVRDMMANAGEYTFYFAGNIDVEAFKPLMEQYIATLPASSEKAGFTTNPAFEFVTGTNTTNESMAMTTPQVWAMVGVSGHVKYTPENKAIIKLLSSVLDKRLLNKVREEMGATYSIGAGAAISGISNNNALVQIPFPMKPELKDEVMAAVNKILDEAETNITDAELAPFKEFLVKEAVEAQEENSEWLEAMTLEKASGVDTFNGYVDVINAVTADQVMKFWKELRAQGNIQYIFLNPAE